MAPRRISGVRELEIHPVAAMYGGGTGGVGDGLVEVLVYGDEHAHVAVDEVSGEGANVQFCDPGIHGESGQSGWSEVYASLTFDPLVSVVVTDDEVAVERGGG